MPSLGPDELYCLEGRRAMELETRLSELPYTFRDWEMGAGDTPSPQVSQAPRATKTVFPTV